MKICLFVLMIMVLPISFVSAQHDTIISLEGSTVQLEKEPKPINLDQVRSQIGYPADAVELGVQGKVVVSVKIDPSGKYISHTVIKEGHKLLLLEVEKHLKKLRFVPGELGGKPVECWVTLPFEFKLID